MEKYQNPDAFKVGDIVYRTDAYANKGYRSLYRITSKRKMFDCCIFVSRIDETLELLFVEDMIALADPSEYENMALKNRD